MKTALKRLLLHTALVALLTSGAHAQLFVPGSGFTVNASNSPTSFNAAATLGGGTQSLNSGSLDLFVQTVTAGKNEWLVFKYETPGVPGAPPLSAANEDWALNEVGLDANQKLNLVNGFVQFVHDNGPILPTSSVFSNFHAVSAPPADLTSILVGGGLLANPVPPVLIGGPGALPSLGSFIDPFGQLDGTGVPSALVTGYTEALEFAPASSVGPTIPEPSTWLMGLIGFGLMGLLGYRKTRNALA
jgi:hypothetical protein